LTDLSVFKSLDSITLLFVLDLSQNGCQFNMSRNVFLSFRFVRIRVCLEAGAKVQLLLISQAFLKFFLNFFFKTQSPLSSLTQYLCGLASPVTDGKYNYF
jgi:hypothetical protein